MNEFFDDQPATQSEAYREMVHNLSMDCSPEQEWILTPYDTWERNPNYSGPRGPHPEDTELYDISGLDSGCSGISDEELEKLTAPETPDNLPF